MNDIRGWFIGQGLVRRRKGRIIAGVCAGIAAKYDLPAWLVRAVYLLSWAIPGPHMLLYLALCFLMPLEGEPFSV